MCASGGLHPTSLPEEAALHADTVVTGPGEGAWQAFLADFRAGRPKPRYDAGADMRSLEGIPPVRRDLIERRRYLCPNSIVVSRGCPHHCDFCYKDAFYEGGRSFYTQTVDAALAEIDRLPGRHLYFLDDHLLGDRRFAEGLFEGMRGMGRLFQGASTVQAILRGDLIERAAAAGMRSVFVGFETLNPENLRRHEKQQNLGRDYDEVIRRCHDLGVMVNGSFVFGLDDDGPDVFERTVEWGVSRSLETATFHIMTPYPGTALHQRLVADDRIVTNDWERYDTRHVVFTPKRMTPEQLEAGYWRAYRDFYRWGAIWHGAAGQDTAHARARHLAYAGGWRKFEPLWDLLIRSRHVNAMLPALGADARCLHRCATQGPRSARHERSRADRPLDGLVSAPARGPSSNKGDHVIAAVSFFWWLIFFVLWVVFLTITMSIARARVTVRCCGVCSPASSRGSR